MSNVENNYELRIASYPIFLVDDNEIYLKTLEKHLVENLNFNVNIYSFSNGEDCLKKMHLKPGIVVLDYFLNSKNAKEVNGLEILKKIKLTRPETIVLMLSKQDDVEIATATMKYGAFDYISKSDNAFLRVQNAINNIDRIITQSQELRVGKQVKRVLIAWIILLIAVIVIMQVFFPELMQKNRWA